MQRTLPNFGALRRASERYKARWEAMVRQGARPVVLNRADHPEQWRSWLAYFRLNGLDFSVELMTERSSTTVPCEWPADFDAVPVAPDRRMVD